MTRRRSYVHATGCRNLRGSGEESERGVVNSGAHSRASAHERLGQRDIELIVNIGDAIIRIAKNRIILEAKTKMKKVMEHSTHPKEDDAAIARKKLLEPLGTTSSKTENPEVDLDSIKIPSDNKLLSEAVSHTRLLVVRNFQESAERLSKLGLVTVGGTVSLTDKGKTVYRAEKHRTQKNRN
ncbi:hypothetical protein HOF56_01230 [Candidatus Peribacteria bacterium]|jgi:hypothetical protein|nr:hypothetical protein [Candidatus Peribacteria bacterium]MBT4021650.1 hypothetical protein [Candidatus Peribacteria bacterium]MBT4240814.1 hypothetical protein [Candidatus Peribacteria bacterium]MBT4474157.1 hypothetical protein [Candidatus Peribacteria bacterium]